MGHYQLCYRVSPTGLRTQISQLCGSLGHEPTASPADCQIHTTVSIYNMQKSIVALFIEFIDTLHPQMYNYLGFCVKSQNLELGSTSMDQNRIVGQQETDGFRSAGSVCHGGLDLATAELPSGRLRHAFGAGPFARLVMPPLAAEPGLSVAGGRSRRLRRPDAHAPARTSRTAGILYDFQLQHIRSRNRSNKWGSTNELSHQQLGQSRTRCRTTYRPYSRLDLGRPRQ